MQNVAAVQDGASSATAETDGNGAVVAATDVDSTHTEPTNTESTPAVVEAVPVPAPTFTTTYTYIDQLLHLIDTDIVTQERVWKHITAASSAHNQLIDIIQYVEQCKRHVIDLPNTAAFDAQTQTHNSDHAQYWVERAKLQLRVIAHLIVLHLYLQANVSSEFETSFAAWYTHAKQRRLNEFLRKHTVELNWQ